MITPPHDASDTIKLTLKDQRKLAPLPDMTRRLTREERRAAMRAEKKKLRKTPMKEKTWEDVSAQCAEVFTQINDTKTEVIAQVFNPILDDHPMSPGTIAPLRAKAKDLETSLEQYAAELRTIEAKQAGRTGKITAEDASEYDDIQMDLMDFQLRYIQTVIPKSSTVALDAADYIAALETQCEEINKEDTPQ